VQILTCETSENPLQVITKCRCWVYVLFMHFHLDRMNTQQVL